MRTVTATQASRSFAALLDEVERGETVVVTRGGRRIATIGPAVAGDGGEVIALLTSNSVDEDFAVDVLAAREETLPVEPHDVTTAEAHGRLLAHVHREGTRRGAHDLIIAATAVATKRIVLTADRNAHSDALPGVDCLVV